MTSVTPQSAKVQVSMKAPEAMQPMLVANTTSNPFLRLIGDPANQPLSLLTYELSFASKQANTNQQLYKNQKKLDFMQAISH